MKKLRLTLGAYGRFLESGVLSVENYDKRGEGCIFPCETDISQLPYTSIIVDFDDFVKKLEELHEKSKI